MWSRRSLALLVLLALTVVAPRPSAADVKDEARKLAMKGVALLDEGKAAEALSKLEAAEAKFHAPTHLLYMARAQRALGRAQAAHRTYAKILVEKIPNYAPDAFHKAQDDAKAEIVGLENDVATVEIELAGPRAETAEVAIDGEVLGPRLWTVPVAVAPGDHRVSARLGAGEVETTVTAVMGHVVVARLDLSAPPEPPTSTQPLAPEGDSGGFPWVGTTLLAVGAAGLIAGTVTGVMTLGRASDIKADCNGTSCPPELAPDADSAKTLGNASTGLFIAGGALAAAGIVVLIVELTGDAPDEPAVALEARPGGFVLRGRF
ncbi:MAG: hypothetical protein R3B72_29080 [Polyangiaceae bacterium]